MPDSIIPYLYKKDVLPALLKPRTRIEAYQHIMEQLKWVMCNDY